MFHTDGVNLRCPINVTHREAVEAKHVKKQKLGAYEDSRAAHQPGDADLAREFGSKLAAVAAHFWGIIRQGEKAIVFCQWEDLKKIVADALRAFGVKGVLQ